MVSDTSRCLEVGHRETVDDIDVMNEDVRQPFATMYATSVAAGGNSMK